MKTTKNTTREAAIDAIIEYFRKNEDVFNDCIEELDGCNEYLGNDKYYFMKGIDEVDSEAKPSEILFRAFYGYDEETWTTDISGHKACGAFNPNRKYFRFSGYGHLVSADHKDYSAFLDRYAVESMSENRSDIYSIDDNSELAALFDALEEADEESEE